MTHLSLLATISTVTWTPKVAILMVTCNVFAIVIGYYAIKRRGTGPSLPFPLPPLFSDFGTPELLATASFGHLLGAGLILGLANAGLL
ncbi:MAG: photosystem I reaction center subunit PsaK [Merismopedia sp. SIO2A8]|nr:photosystem I reaction center subunit PsaK [Merismopedia sp. SIO2A8]